MCSIENLSVRACYVHIPHIVSVFQYNVPNCSRGHDRRLQLASFVGMPAQIRLQRQRSALLYFPRSATSHIETRDAIFSRPPTQVTLR